jgi:hypothetical protein
MSSPFGVNAQSIIHKLKAMSRVQVEALLSKINGFLVGGWVLDA